MEENFKKPPEFYGVWGRMRSEFLQQEHPAVYHSLLKSGRLIDYLEGYQRAYSQRAELMDAQLCKEHCLDDALMERDPLRWIVLAEKIHLEILERLKQEIQR